jgi:hypothetical protein
MLAFEVTASDTVYKAYGHISRHEYSKYWTE